MHRRASQRVLPTCARVCDGRFVRADSDGHRSGHAQLVMHSLAPEAAPCGADRDRRDKEACDGSGAMVNHTMGCNGL